MADALLPHSNMMQVTWEELQKLCAEVVLFSSSPGSLFIVRGAEECAKPTDQIMGLCDGKDL